MKRKKSPFGYTLSLTNSHFNRMERREWFLWSFVVVVTLLLTGSIASFALPLAHGEADSFYWVHIRQSVRALLGLVLLFDIYSQLIGSATRLRIQILASRQGH
jgi:hypothetical protein